MGMERGGFGILLDFSATGLYIIKKGRNSGVPKLLRLDVNVVNAWVLCAASLL